ncbi:MAG: hypothetical protein ACK41S_15695 [Planctomycetota bacterium]
MSFADYLPLFQAIEIATGQGLGIELQPGQQLTSLSAMTKCVSAAEPITMTVMASRINPRFRLQPRCLALEGSCR